MKKYEVVGIGYYNCRLEVFAENAEEAGNKAQDLFPPPSLCHSFGSDFELMDINFVEVSEIK